MKKILKCICLLAVMVLSVTSLAGCTIKVNVKVDGELPSFGQVETAVSAEQTVVQETTHTDASSVAESVNTSQTTEANTNSAPTADSLGLPQLIQKYNSAINTSLVCVNRTQKLKDGLFWNGSDKSKAIDLAAPEQEVFLQYLERIDTNGNQLSPVNEADVADFKVEGNTVTFYLKNSTVNGTISQGNGGYINIVDEPIIQEIFKGILEYNHLKANVNIQNQTYTLTEGVIKATFSDETFSSLTSVDFSGKENAVIGAKVLILACNADINYELSSQYKGA